VFIGGNLGYAHAKECVKNINICSGIIVLLRFVYAVSFTSMDFIIIIEKRDNTYRFFSLAYLTTSLCGILIASHAHSKVKA